MLEISQKQALTHEANLVEFTDRTIAALNVTYNLFKKKLLTREDALTQITTTLRYFEVMMNYVKSPEERQFERQHGSEVILAGGPHVRKTSWFEETGKSLATGIADEEFALAIVHPQLGMAAARSVMFVKPPREDLAGQFLDDAQVSALRLLLHPVELKGVDVTQAEQVFLDLFQRTLHAFLLLNNKPHKGTQICITGGSTFSPPLIDRLLGKAKKIIYESEEFKHLRKNTNLVDRLGKPGGILYGLQLAEPQFYQSATY